MSNILVVVHLTSGRKDKHLVSSEIFNDDMAVKVLSTTRSFGFETRDSGFVTYKTDAIERIDIMGDKYGQTKEEF